MSEEKTRLKKSNFTVEFFVGLFFIFGLLSLSYLANNLAGMRLGGGSFYTIKAQFDNISGLKNGASVEIAGVSIGKVSKIELAGTNAELTLEIDGNIKLREDDIASIRTKGIIGDRFVKINPGGSDMFLEDGALLFDTESAVEFEDVISRFIHSLD